MLVKTDQAAAVVSADDPGVFNGAICKGMAPTRLGKMTDQTADFSISLYCAVGHMDVIHRHIVAICVANYNTHLISVVLAIDGDVSAIKCKVLDCNRIFCRRTGCINGQLAHIADDVGLIGNKVCLCCGQ